MAAEYEEIMHGKLAILPDIRLVYHESGRWKSLAGYQDDKSCEEAEKEDHHNTKTAFTGYYKRMADSPHREKIAGAQKQALSKNTNGSTTVLITKDKRSCR